MASNEHRECPLHEIKHEKKERKTVDEDIC